MALKKEVYRELEDILGPEYISEEPMVLDSYSFIGSMPARVLSDGVWDRFTRLPEAVVLPGSTKDVQAIIKWCNKHRIIFRAFSTGYGAGGTIDHESAILMDLRRMNRILDIDEKNMIVVVEPYVSFIQVQAEVMKRGLNCHIIGAGSQVSYLASVSSMVGNNAMAVSQGVSSRNILGLEWVLPNGEIMHFGSMGSGAGWFSTEGPGPSLRGIVRGATGAQGGLGVFTKCAGHLHPWQGDTHVEVKGVSPNFETELPQYFEYHVISWPNWDRCADAQYKIGESGIAFALQKTGGPGAIGACVVGSNDEFYEKRQKGEFDIPEVSWSIVMTAYTQKEHDYKVEVLNAILSETDGTILPLGEDPAWKNCDFINTVKASLIPRMAFRLAGTFTSDKVMAQETIDHEVLALDLDGRLADKHLEKGVLFNDGTYNNWGVINEDGHWGLIEGGWLFDPTNEESVIGMHNMQKEGLEMALKTPIALGWTVNCGFVDQLGSRISNFNNWIHKIKNAFDPNSLADPSKYVPGK